MLRKCEEFVCVCVYRIVCLSVCLFVCLFRLSARVKYLTGGERETSETAPQLIHLRSFLIKKHTYTVFEGYF